MVVILGLFYFGQDQYLQDETAIYKAVNNTIQWLLEREYRHVLVEINNECDVQVYTHDCLKPHCVAELITYAQKIHQYERRLLVSTSYKGNTILDVDVIAQADFILMHGNGVT